jgi:hypothetical protein
MRSLYEIQEQIETHCTPEDGRAVALALCAVADALHRIAEALETWLSPVKGTRER